MYSYLAITLSLINGSIDEVSIGSLSDDDSALDAVEEPAAAKETYDFFNN